MEMESWKMPDIVLSERCGAIFLKARCTKTGMVEVFRHSEPLSGSSRRSFDI